MATRPRPSTAIYRRLEARTAGRRSARLSPRGFRSPTLDVLRKPEPIRRVEISQEELAALRTRARGFKDRRFALFVELLIDTGARKSELLERRWRDVDLERREIVCELTKTGLPRVLHFREETGELILRVFPRRDNEALLFEGKVPGQPITFRTAWTTCARDIGLEQLHMHDIRHAVAARLLRECDQSIRWSDDRVR